MILSSSGGIGTVATILEGRWTVQNRYVTLGVLYGFGDVTFHNGIMTEYFSSGKPSKSFSYTIDRDVITIDQIGQAKIVRISDDEVHLVKEGAVGEGTRYEERYIWQIHILRRKAPPPRCALHASLSDPHLL
jgi:hypothetical protein